MTDDRREVRTCSRVRLGKVDQISAAAPATWGEAIEVPLSYAYPEATFAVT
jgi:hypothetical protein